MSIKVSVIIPVYNSQYFLKERIESILEQSYNQIEIIILDDNSMDDSYEEISKFLPHPKIKKIRRNKVNSGSPFGSWEKAFQLAKGEFIWIAEADDFCKPDFLEKIVKAFEDPEVAVSHCRSFDYQSETNFKKNEWWDSFGSEIWDSNFVECGKVLLEKYGRFKCPVINVSSAVFRKSALEEVEVPFAFKYCGDWWFWAQIFQKGKVAFVAEPLNFFRKHEASATSFYNINLASFSYEATIIAKRINNLCNTRFKYEINYSWLVDFWYRGLLINKDFKVWSKFFFSMPISFQWRIFKSIIAHYMNKLFP